MLPTGILVFLPRLLLYCMAFSSLSITLFSHRSLVHILILPFSVSTPHVFFIAGEAGGIKYASSMTSLSVFPRFVMLYPPDLSMWKKFLPINSAALLSNLPLLAIIAASNSPGSRAA